MYEGPKYVFEYQDARGHVVGDAAVCACGAVTMDPDNRFTNAFSKYAVDNGAMGIS